MPAGALTPKSFAVRHAPPLRCDAVPQPPNPDPAPYRSPGARRRSREDDHARLEAVRVHDRARVGRGRRIERAHPASPTQLRTQPRRQPSPAHDRHRPAPLLRTNPQLHRPPPRQGKTKKKPSAASNASSPQSSTAPSEPTSPPSQPALDIYRNVPERFIEHASTITGEAHCAIEAEIIGASWMAGSDFADNFVSAASAGTWRALNQRTTR